MAERAYEKHAWILFFVVGVAGLVFPIFNILGLALDAQEVKSSTGITFDEISSSYPRIANYVKGLLRFFGVATLFLIFFALGVAAVPYRRGERWAWYVLWGIPMFLIAVIAINFSLGGGSWPVLTVFLAVALWGLLLPYKKFFSRKQPRLQLG